MLDTGIFTKIRSYQVFIVSFTKTIEQYFKRLIPKVPILNQLNHILHTRWKIFLKIQIFHPRLFQQVFFIIFTKEKNILFAQFIAQFQIYRISCADNLASIHKELNNRCPGGFVTRET